jgi:8-oxo-dGTP pyrophosphatase MutT (NUDIX family)/phosphohistidine phosphatase SixA
MAERVGEDLIRASGAVVWREPDQDPRIVLVHRPKYDDWSFPKGKAEPGEHVLLTAAREVAEETGLLVVLGRRLAPSEYEVAGRPKHVSYWAARCVGSEGFVPGHEVDELIWLSAGQARERLSYERDVKLLDEFTAGPADSVPFILLRHAEAGAKSPGDPLDLSRPLDARGRTESSSLAELLACYGRCRVLSSAAERCLATVRPYAAAVGAEVEIEPAFTVPLPPGDAPGGQAKAARRAADLVAECSPTLVCAHRENLPVMTAAARSALGADWDVSAASAGPSSAETNLTGHAGSDLRKGSFIVLQAAGGVLISTEQHDLLS